MKKSSLTTEGLEKLLMWLNPNREIAGNIYGEIHFKLTKIFARRGCSNPEELADETIDRVIQKVPEIEHCYKGDPALYFYGFVKYVFLDYLKRRPELYTLPQAHLPEYGERRFECLDECLAKLEAEEHDLILEYYEGDKDAKIKNRKALADSLGITIETLRTRVQRIKGPLRKCVKTCIDVGE